MRWLGGAPPEQTGPLCGTPPGGEPPCLCVKRIFSTPLPSFTPEPVCLCRSVLPPVATTALDEPSSSLAPSRARFVSRSCSMKVVLACVLLALASAMAPPKISLELDGAAKLPKPVYRKHDLGLTQPNGDSVKSRQVRSLSVMG